MPWKVGAVFGGAFLIGLTLFWLTSSTDASAHLGMCPVEIAREAGFDPWTGQPHGETYLWTECLPGFGDGATHVITDDPPTTIAARRAVSVPLGTALGVIVLGSVVLYTDRRGRILTVGGAALR